MFRFGFGKGRDKGREQDPEKRTRMKAQVRTALGLAADVAVSINEIACADPSCPVLETIVLVMPPGQKTRAYKLHGALDDISDDALRAALAAQA